MKFLVSKIPPEGTLFEGSTDENIFRLQDDAFRPSGALHYAFHAYPIDEGAAFSGSLRVPFELECTRCLSHFPYEVRLEDFAAEVPVSGDNFADLTEAVREDILLALPGYPRCEQSTQEGWKCAAEGRFDQSGEDAEKDDPSPWGALDGLGTPDH